jgi:hypothetical protein
MTIEDAIKILSKEPGMVRGIGMQVRIDAIKLGIEALKRMKELRDGDWGNPLEGLQGETRKIL